MIKIALRTGLIVALFYLPALNCAQNVRTRAGGSKRQTAQRKIIIENADVTLSAVEDGFEVTLPGVPEKYFVKGDPAIEKPDKIEYDLKNGEDYYSIRYADYDFIVTDPIKLKILYDLVKKTYLENSEKELGNAATLVSESDIYLDGRLGRELVVAVNKRVVWVHSFLIQQRLYQLYFSTPLQKQTLATVRIEKGKTAAKFFNSFKITKLPPPLTSPQSKQ